MKKPKSTKIKPRVSKNALDFGNDIDDLLAVLDEEDKPSIKQQNKLLASKIRLALVELLNNKHLNKRHLNMFLQVLHIQLVFIAGAK